MNIFCEKGDTMLFLDIKSNKISYKKKINKSFDNFISYDFDIKGEKKVFFMQENRFSFYSFKIDLLLDKIFGVKDLNDIITQKSIEIDMKYGRPGILVLYDIENIYVDGQEKKYVIGEKGKISFNLNFVFLNHQTADLFRILEGNRFFEDKNIIIFPQNYHLIKYLQKTLNKKLFNIIILNQNNSKLIKVKNGFFDGYSEINFGIENLKDNFLENNIETLYYKTFQNEEFNDISMKLIKESMDFFNDIFLKWVSENVGIGEDIVLISKLSENPHFIQSLNSISKKYNNGYMLPFSKNNDLNLFSANWNISDYDVLCGLNYCCL